MDISLDTLRDKLLIDRDSEYGKYNDQKFTILNEVPKESFDYDAVGPMWKVLTEAGDEIYVFHDEAFDFSLGFFDETDSIKAPL